MSSHAGAAGTTYLDGEGESLPRPSSVVHQDLATRLEAAENPENLIQRVGDLLERRAAIQQARDAAQQVAEQIARARNRGDVEDDGIGNADHQPEHVQVDGSRSQVRT